MIMAKSVTLQSLVGNLEHACGTIANLLVDLGKSVVSTQASILPMAAECLTARTVLRKLGTLLAPGDPTEPNVTDGSSSWQITNLDSCFEVILQSISEILIDVDREVARLRRYHTQGDPLAAMKVIPVLQDFFIDAKFCLRRNRSSLSLILDCLQSGNLSEATIQLSDQIPVTHLQIRKAEEPSRLQPLVAIQLHKISEQPDIRQLFARYRQVFAKYRQRRANPHESGSRLTRKLHEAITKHDHGAVHKSLSAKASPHLPLDQSGTLPIHRALDQVESSLASANKAAAGASASIVTALVIAGAHLRSPDENGRTPLVRAVMNEMPDSLISLMLEFGASANAKDRERNTALHHAASKAPSDEMGNINAIRILLVYGADQGHRNKKGRTPLHEAVSFECFDRARELLDYGADLEVADNNGWTPLLGAVIQGSATLAKLLCDRGAMIDKKDKNGHTPLHYAISQGCNEVAEVLLDAGANVNLISKGEAPLCRATSKSNFPLIKLLLARGANVTLPSPGYYGALPIHIAAMGNDLAILKALLEAGSPINAVDDELRTPLRWAMDGGKNEFVHFLFSKGAAR
ncbi:ankyrin repeat-containing domain protein [Hypoxylon crocopeplum]|nr:ankyrin repeat-containing domain protein [Hypoxylon crocopeplum]